MPGTKLSHSERDVRRLIVFLFKPQSLELSSLVNFLWQDPRFGGLNEEPLLKPSGKACAAQMGGVGSWQVKQLQKVHLSHVTLLLWPVSSTLGC